MYLQYDLYAAKYVCFLAEISLGVKLYDYYFLVILRQNLGNEREEQNVGHFMCFFFILPCFFADIVEINQSE